MPPVLDRPATTQPGAGGAENPQRPSGRRPPVVTGRELLIGLALAVAWGLFLWLFIAGAIASFGNPWLAS